MDALAAVEGVTWASLDMCRFGLRDPENHLLYKKAMSLLNNLPEGVLTPIFLRCRNHNPATHLHHAHQKVEGWSKGYGRRSAISQVYPWAFCRRLAQCLTEFVYELSSPALEATDMELLTEILEGEEDSLEELQALSTWYQTRASGVLLGLNHHATALSTTALETKPVPVKNYKIMELINWVNSLAKNTEIMIQGEDSNVSLQLVRQLKLVRQHFLPLQQFEGCTILRGTLGSVNPADYLDDSSYCIMWKKKESKMVYVARVGVVHT